MTTKKIVRWTRQEDRLLSDNYESCTAAELSARIKGRSEKAIHRRARRLNLCSKTPKVTIEKVRESFLINGFLVKQEEYVNAVSPIEAVCSKGHNFKLSWNKFKSGRGCQICYYDPSEMYIKVRDSFDAEGYKLNIDPSGYAGSHIKVPFTCPAGHAHEISWNDFDQGNRCGKCSVSSSRAEKEVYSFVLQQSSDAVPNTKKVIPPFELDIHVPSANLAIEYCGLRWHSEHAAGKARNYHRKKMEDCLKHGIRLITIFEDEWLQSPGIVKSRITQALSKTMVKVYARNLTFDEISLQDAKEFLNDNHLQGYSPCLLRFGLRDSTGTLLQVMTFGKLTRAHASASGTSWELKRLASSSGLSVVGGASKLFKNSLKRLPEGITSVKSYCDLRWANTDLTVYSRLGFIEVAESKYTPHYTKRQKRYRNHTLRKTPEERLTGKTEWELRREQGFDRIWDCGHKTYLFKIRR